MSRFRFGVLVFGLALFYLSDVWAGGRHPAAPRGSAFVAGAPRFSVGHLGRGVVRRDYPHVFHYGHGYFYQPYYPNVVVISPYAPAYLLPPTVVVTMPYFCALHNEGYVSRIGLLDHLAGMHKIPLDAATNFCPDGVGSCVFPSY